MIVTSRRMLAVFGVVVAFATGCGGSSSGAPPAARTSTPAAVHSSPAPAPATAAAASPTAADCGPVPGETPLGQTPHLVIVKGEISCAAALAVLRQYGAAPKQGSAGMASFDGWNCAHGSVADLRSTGRFAECEKSDGSVRLQTRLTSPVTSTPTATRPNSAGAGGGGGGGTPCTRYGSGMIRVSGPVTCATATLIISLFYSTDIQLGKLQADVKGWSCSGSMPPAYDMTCTKGGATISIVSG